MRKQLLLFCLLLSAGLSIGQAYQPFDTTTTWNIVRTNARHYSSEACVSDDLYNYYTNGYLVNNGFTWHKMYANVVPFNYYDYYTHVSCGAVPASTPATVFAGMFCNDIPNKRVYFVPSATLTPNFVPGTNNILFDFNKTIGDMMYVMNSEDPSGPVLYYKISSIDSLLFEGVYHKRFNGYTPTPDSFQPYISWFIEGVGNPNGVFNAEFNFSQQRTTLLFCFSGPTEAKRVPNSISADAQNIIPVANCNWLYTGINELSSDNFRMSIYPNPNSGILTISIPVAAQSKAVLIIKDLTGREIKNYPLANIEEQRIDLRELPNGVYMAAISCDKQAVYTGKIIKQD